jgi:hypothetical protein
MKKVERDLQKLQSDWFGTLHQGTSDVPHEGNGFVLAEAVVALTIGAIAIGGALLALRQGQMLHVETLKRTQALALNEKQLRLAATEAKGIGATTGKSGDGLTWTTKVTPLSRAITLDGRPYQSPAIGQQSGGQGTRFWQVTTIVNWQDGRRQRSHTLTTIVPAKREAPS